MMLENAWYLDIIGKKFGKLIVVSVSDQPETAKSRGPYYACSCECGGTKIVSRHCLIGGRTKSCGCLRHNCGSQYHPRKTQRIVIDLTGHRFGLLTVIRLADSPTGYRGHSYWLCRCDCGNEIVVSSDDLNRYKVDCGCLVLEERKQLRKAIRIQRRNNILKKYREVD